MKKIITIKVTSADMAKAEALDWADHVVSAIDPGKEAAIPGMSQHIEHFDDYENDDVSTDKDGITLGGFQLPQLEHVERILEFTDKILDGQNVVVHCHAGICRSTAIAVLMHVQCGFTPEEAIKRVERQRPQLWPNRLVIAHGDEILGFDGKIVEAVQKFMDDNSGVSFDWKWTE